MDETPYQLKHQEIESIGQFITIISNLNQSKILFRGQAREFSDIYPSVIREKQDEFQIILDFANKYPKNISLNSPSSIEMLLIEMQHKGFSTRLLDVTSNPIVALYNALGTEGDKHINMDGIVYVFLEGVNYRSEFGSTLKGSFYFTAQTIAMLKKLYLNLGLAQTESDILTMLLNIFATNSNRTNAEFGAENFLHSGFKEMLQIFLDEILSDKIKTLLPEDKLSQLLINNHQKALVAYFGLPILISPNFHQYEQNISFRIAMQSSKFLIWPNKILHNEEIISNKYGSNYPQTLTKLIIPAQLKSKLRNQIKLIYNENMLYIDGMPNKY
jgi:hypothetical protein